jgi:hypothetical protein
MPNPTCPRCMSEGLRSIESWRISTAELKTTGPPQPMWACRNPMCQYRWPRESDESPDFYELLSQRATKINKEGDRPR